ncbi:MAG TPA: hypothetical protein VGF17_27560 [Phytomonospora sp.]
MPELPVWLSSLLPWVGAASLIVGSCFAVWRTLQPIVHGIRDFLDDWNGEHARPGVGARPGVMARLSAQDDRLSAIEHELHPNGGSSMRDAIDRLEKAGAQTVVNVHPVPPPENGTPE